VCVCGVCVVCVGVVCVVCVCGVWVVCVVCMVCVCGVCGVYVCVCGVVWCECVCLCVCWVFSYYKICSKLENVSASVRKEMEIDPNTQVPGVKVKGKVHPCTGTEALYRPYGP
jgi:hypothetical protein